MSQRSEPGAENPRVIVSRLVLAHVVLTFLTAACSQTGPIAPIEPPDRSPLLTRVVPESAEIVITVGQSLEFEIEAQSTGGKSVRYEYRMEEGVVATDARYVFTPVQAGTYRVEGIASDGQGTAARTWTVTVLPAPNALPTAVLSLEPASGPAPLALRLRLTGADPDGVITRFRVEITGAASMAIERAAPIDTTLVLGMGSYTVTGSVEDDRGATRSASGTVSVHAPPPPPDNLAPTLSLVISVLSGEAPLATTARASAQDSDGVIASMALDFDGDGIPEVTGPGPELQASHTYPTAGTYTVRASAVDDEGASATATATVVVHAPNAAPTGSLSASSASGDAPLSVTLLAAGSDVDGQIVRWELDVDDGAGFADIPAAAMRTVVYPFRVSAYRPRLRLTDDRGARTVVDGPAITVYRPVSSARSGGSATGNPRFDDLSIAPAIWADGSDRLRFTIQVLDHDGHPLIGAPLRVTSSRPDYVLPDGTRLGDTVTITLDGTATDAAGRLTGDLTTNTSSRAYAVPSVGAFQSFALKVEADAGHGEWRRLPDIAGLNAETPVDGSTGAGQLSVVPSGLVCTGTPLEIHVRAVRRSDAPGGIGPAGGRVTEIRYAASGAPIPGLRPAPGYEGWRTDADGRIVFQVTLEAENFQALRAWVDGQPLTIPAGFAVQSC